ncbi:hypothetical protein N665_1043s0024 [Sinapis alba]|nr:hypothetical protein N665_1043s0024 [Sinapis alba]
MVPTFVRPVMTQLTRGFSRSVVSRRSFSSSGEFSTGQDMIVIIRYVSSVVAGAAAGWGIGIGTLDHYLEKLPAKEDLKK